MPRMGKKAQAAYTAQLDANRLAYQVKRDAADWKALECEPRAARTPCLAGMRHSFNNADGIKAHVCDNCRQAFAVEPRPAFKRTTVRGILTTFVARSN